VHLPRCAQNQNLVPTAHQPICTFTFTIGTNGSPSYMYNYKGFGLGTLHSPPSYLCTVINAFYTHVHTKFQKSSKRWEYSTCIGSSHSQVASSGPYQVHWTFYQLHDSIPELFGFSIQYANRSHSKIVFWLHLNHIPINNMISIREILFKQRYMENIMNTQG
jgi:hypothetical protein